MRAFRKMHGLGNDFVVFDAREVPLALSSAQVRDLADRHTGIGCDQLIVVAPSDRADAFMAIWNADGSVAEACGNAARCVATLLGARATIDSAGGLLDAQATGGAARVTYPAPRFEWDAVPLAYPLDTCDVPAAWEEGGTTLAHGVAVNVGNPHIVFFVADASAVPLDVLGPRIEHDALFPDRVNVGVAQVVDRAHLILRVWERGAGLTRACGTGAMAAAVAAMRRRLVDEQVTVTLPGGDLTVAWHSGGPTAAGNGGGPTAAGNGGGPTAAGNGGSIVLSGPAATSFTGEVDL